MTFKNNLKGYRLVYSRTSEKFINKAEKQVSEKIKEKLEDLVDGVQGLDIKPLQAYDEPTYRLRVGEFRIIFTLWHNQVIVYVIEIGHRREIYE